MSVLERERGRKRDRYIMGRERERVRERKKERKSERERERARLREKVRKRKMKGKILKIISANFHFINCFTEILMMLLK